MTKNFRNHAQKSSLPPAILTTIKQNNTHQDCVPSEEKFRIANDPHKPALTFFPRKML